MECKCCQCSGKARITSPAVQDFAPHQLERDLGGSSSITPVHWKALKPRKHFFAFIEKETKNPSWVFFRNRFGSAATGDICLKLRSYAWLAIVANRSQRSFVWIGREVRARWFKILGHYVFAVPLGSRRGKAQSIWSCTQIRLLQLNFKCFVNYHHKGIIMQTIYALYLCQHSMNIVWTCMSIYQYVLRC